MKNFIQNIPFIALLAQILYINISGSFDIINGLVLIVLACLQIRNSIILREDKEKELILQVEALKVSKEKELESLSSTVKKLEKELKDITHKLNARTTAQTIAQGFKF